MIDLMNIQPNKVSIDLSQYPMVFVGETGDGKTDSANRYLTAIAPEGKKPLFIEFEDRYKAIPNLMAIRVHSISDLLSIVSQLRNPMVREKFSCVVFDTMDKFEEMASRYHAENKEVEIIEDLNFGKGKRYLNATVGIVTEITNLGLPVNYICQLYTNKDIITKITTRQTKLKDTTKAQIFHDAFLVGKLMLDSKAKDPLHSDRLITFRKTAEDIELKDGFGLPPVMHVGELKTNLEKLFETRYDKNELTNEKVLTEIKEDVSFEDIKTKGMELGNKLAELGHLNEALNILKINIGQDEQGNAKTFDSLLPSQVDLAKVVVLRLEELANKYLE